MPKGLYSAHKPGHTLPSGDRIFTLVKPMSHPRLRLIAHGGGVWIYALDSTGTGTGGGRQLKRAAEEKGAPKGKSCFRYSHVFESP